MPVESINDVLPFFDWLLGPGWVDGGLFHTWVLMLLVPLAALALAWLFARLRAGSAVAARLTGRVLALGVVGSALLVGLTVGWRALLGTLVERFAVDAGQQRPPTSLERLLAGTDAALAALFHGSQRLLGEEWFRGALYKWMLVVAAATLVCLVVGSLAALMRGGLRYARKTTDDVLAALVSDLVGISPRRLLALAWLAAKEAIRGRVVVVFAVFVLILLFAGWFLDPSSRDPARLYIDWVLTLTSYLMLLLALFLSALSLPTDIKNRTLHTVVTKPVRSSEIVLSRMLGFMAVGTVLLAVMGLVSYGFVVRGLSHTHSLTAADLRPTGQVGGQAAGGRGPILKGVTSQTNHHRHNVVIDSTGKGRVEMEQGHWHELTIEGTGKDAIYTVGAPQGMLVARVPVYGKLAFKNRHGEDAERGVNVGDEWTYRSFIEGGSHAAAVWTFQGITESQFPDGLPLELTIEVFRTFKGDLEKGIPGSLSVRNPKTGRKVEVRIFSAKKFATDVQFIPRILAGLKGEKIDLFKDLVADGQVEIWLQCLQSQQYFGMAQADLYLRARDSSFALNFAAGYLGIWLQMALVIGMGVMFSTFLSGPVAAIATLGAMAAGIFSDFLGEVASGKILGGGPFESGIRIVTQQNLISDMEPGLRTNAAKFADRIVEMALWGISSLLPEFARFDFADHVSYGFDVGNNLLGQCICRALAFLLPVFVAGYLFLKTREVAK